MHDLPNFDASNIDPWWYSCLRLSKTAEENWVSGSCCTSAADYNSNMQIA